ncbi:MAG TPA: hypothetical protein DHV76_05470 [Ruminococcaceae bacterium]|nr:hypothetical protein [Oscillospiraceae bacterium]HCJ96482.1 hypothetical protein [Oscillospiraceae bacterium]
MFIVYIKIIHILLCNCIILRCKRFAVNRSEKVLKRIYQFTELSNIKFVNLTKLVLNYFKFIKLIDFLI